MSQPQTERNTMNATFQGTTKEFGEQLKLDYAVANNTLQFLETMGVAKRAGTKATGKRPSVVWELPLKINLTLNLNTVTTPDTKPVVNTVQVELKNEPVTPTVEVVEETIVLTNEQNDKLNELNPLTEILKAGGELMTPTPFEVVELLGVGVLPEPTVATPKPTVATPKPERIVCKQCQGKGRDANNVDCKPCNGDGHLTPV